MIPAGDATTALQDTRKESIIATGNVASVRRSSSRSTGRRRSFQAPESSPAYVLEYTTEGFQQRLINSVHELRNELRHGTRIGSQRLFVIHGLPLHFSETLETELDVESAFFNAHVGRRRYRPSRTGRAARCESYEYPELVKAHTRLDYPRLSSEPRLVDVMDDPPFHLMSGDGQAALFCHASLWTTDQANVLLLDRPAWRDPASRIHKARRPTPITKLRPPQHRGSGHRESATTTPDLNEEEVKSVEDKVVEHFKWWAERHRSKGGSATNPGQFANLPLSEFVYEHWLEFFETLPPHAGHGATHDGAMYWQATESLEQNLDVSKYLRRRSHGAQSDQHTSTHDWESLLERVQRRVQISALLRPAIAQTRVPSTGVSGVVDGRDNGPGIPTHLDEDREANQRSLDRVTYLGGVLLPFTVVSGILSMNDQFMPDGSGFWIFWVASLVSSGFCLLLIYLDQLRCLEVWFEVAVADAIEALFHQPSPLRRNFAPVIQASARADGTVLLQPLKNLSDLPISYPADGDMEMLADSPANPTIIVQQRHDGHRDQAWRKKKLGWSGAVKQASGYYRLCGRAPVQFAPPGLERFRMKTT